MVLGEALEDGSGTSHRMAGLLGHVTSFARRRLTLGYREARLLSNSPIGRSGQIVRGHEFHYSSLVEAGSDAPLVALSDAQGRLDRAGGRPARPGHGDVLSRDRGGAVAMNRTSSGEREGDPERPRE